MDLRHRFAAAAGDPSAQRPVPQIGRDRAQTPAWNQTRESVASRCIHELVESQAERTPEAAAVIFNERRLTYRELDSRAQEVARHLRSLGVGPESLVAISMERSIEMVVGLLGILKAGGAYVPIDPNYPEDRIATIVADSRPELLLTQPGVLYRFPNYRGPRLLLESGMPLPPAPQGGRGSLHPENLAYAIFTSGSTGKPKGVLIPHRSLVNHSTAMARYYGLGPRDRVLQFASLSFDVAAEEIFPSWLSGATVVLWPVSTGAAPIRNFVGFVEEHGITVLNLPAAYWEEWCLELERFPVPPAVRLVVVGSDRVSVERFSIWRKHVGDRVRWCNAYGPTEATITATVYEPQGDLPPAVSDCVPIGRPIANTEVYLADESMKLVPIGAPGELYIGGAGVARGYLNDPELTQQKFVPNPFGGKSEKLYKTGDLCRYLSDGNLEFLGRTDDQIKIRGYRIEIGEIESALRHFPKVRSAIAVARQNEAEAKKIVAYLVLEDDSRPSPGDFRRFLKDRLPEYMMPDAFVVLRRFPLTPGGKVDRQKLPPPPTPAEMQKNFVPPRTETEAKLVEIWERMLGIKPIGIRDNFFEIGGHSLLEARFVAEVEKSFGITLPVTTLYYTRTIEALVKIIEDNKTSPRNSLWHRCHTQGTKPPLFAYGGSTDLADCLGPDQPLYWSEFHGTDGLPMPDTIEEMAAEYISQMRSIQPHGPYFLLGYSMGGLVIFEAAQQLAAIGEPVGLLVLVDPAPPANMVRIGKTDGGVDSRRFRLKDLGYRVRRRIAWSKRVLGQSFCEACLRHGYRLPPGLRLFYFDYKSQAVLSRYHARTYRGPFILFRRPDNRTAEQWRSLASEDIELHESWVEHYEFLEQPYVQTVAGILRQRLAQARGKSLEGRARAEAQSAWHGDAHPST